MIQYKKAQTSIIDFLIATIIFTILIGISILTLYNYNNKVIEDISYEDIQVKAIQITDSLIKNEGNPTRWEDNISSALVIGLAENDRIIKKEKLDAFADINHSYGVKLLNTGEYNYYFKLKSTVGGLSPINTTNKIIF